MHSEQRTACRFDVVVVGAGFAGLYALYRLRQLGFGVRVLEAGDGIGGTWFWNRYPGARCDIESMQYSFSFSEEIQQRWTWTELYASQPEILSYINFVADELELRRDVQLSTYVSALRFDEETACWHLRTAGGEQFESQFVVMATGCLSVPLTPAFPGCDTFAGPIYRTSVWPKDAVDFRGKRVGVIGTGSSGIQIIPEVAAQAKHLTVFQRTPHYTIPGHNRRLEPAYVDAWKSAYAERRRAALLTRNSTLNDAGVTAGRDAAAEAREAEFERRWSTTGGIGFLYTFTDMAMDADVNQHASNFLRKKIRHIVADPVKAAILTPHDYGFGGKRICVDTHYYETFNRDNVSLVDIRAEPILGFEQRGIRTAAGLHDLDIVVLAIGFDAMTGALRRLDIEGRNRETIRDHWQDGPTTFLGLALSGFPNLFVVTGPGSPSVFANMVISIEQHVDWIAGCIDHMRRNEHTTVEADRAAEAEWFAHVNEVGGRTILARGNNWYVGANVPGKPRYVMPYMGGAATYIERISQIAANGYFGFVFDRGAAPPAVADVLETTLP